MRLPPLTLLLFLLALPAGTAQARKAPCLPWDGGPRCHVWKAKVLDVSDGDTIGVDVRGDGLRRHQDVRFSGIQAMELRRHHPRRRSGQCHSVAATRRVARLIRRSGRVVRLSAQDPRSRQGSRLRRWVAVRIGGRWVDLGDVLVREGLALWMGGQVEWAWNRRYGRGEQLAARAGRRLWNPSACRGGPAADVPIQLWVNYDPVGNDRARGGEWVKVRNLSADRTLRLGRRWRLRDASHLTFRFPRGTRLPPGATATVRVRPGRDRRLRFHWGVRRLVFENPRGDGHHLGGGAYLVDPDGDIRAAMQYPCADPCRNALQGRMAVHAVPRGNERVVVRNDSGAPAALAGYAVKVPGGLVPFRARTVLQPGGVAVVRVPGRRRLRNRGGAVQVVTFSGARIGCDAWGRGRC